MERVKGFELVNREVNRFLACPLRVNAGNSSVGGHASDTNRPRIPSTTEIGQDCPLVHKPGDSSGDSCVLGAQLVPGAVGGQLVRSSQPH